MMISNNLKIQVKGTSIHGVRKNEISENIIEVELKGIIEADKITEIDEYMKTCDEPTTKESNACVEPTTKEFAEDKSALENFENWKGLGVPKKQHNSNRFVRRRNSIMNKQVCEII